MNDVFSPSCFKNEPLSAPSRDPLPSRNGNGNGLHASGIVPWGPTRATSSRKTSWQDILNRDRIERGRKTEPKFPKERVWDEKAKFPQIYYCT